MASGSAQTASPSGTLTASRAGGTGRRRGGRLSCVFDQGQVTCCGCCCCPFDTPHEFLLRASGDPRPDGGEAEEADTPNPTATLVLWPLPAHMARVALLPGHVPARDALQLGGLVRPHFLPAKGSEHRGRRRLWRRWHARAANSPGSVARAACIWTSGCRATHAWLSSTTSSTTPCSSRSARHLGNRRARSTPRAPGPGAATDGRHQHAPQVLAHCSILLASTACVHCISWVG